MATAIQPVRTPRIQFGSPLRAPAKLVSALSSILTLPNPQHYGPVKRCPCRECAAIRAAGFSCVHCGFKGEPVVAHCECASARRNNIRFCRAGITKIEAGQLPKPGDFSLSMLREELEENLARPVARCRANGGKGIRPEAPYCAHGSATCPTCGSAGDDIRADASALAATIRELRAALREVARQ